MNCALVKATFDDKVVMENLMQLYIYDFSGFIGYDVDSKGRYAPYPELDSYWTDSKHRFPYIVKRNDTYVGFALVKLLETEDRTYFSMAEFFILRKYRRSGIGTAMAMQLFDLHRGHWEVYQIESNQPAQLFWKNVIGAYTNGRYQEYRTDGRFIQRFDCSIS